MTHTTPQAPMLDFAAAEAVLRDRASSDDQVEVAASILAHSIDPMHRTMAKNVARNVANAASIAAERKPIPVIDFATPVCQRRAEIEAQHDKPRAGAMVACGAALVTGAGALGSIAMLGLGLLH